MKKIVVFVCTLSMLICSACVPAYAEQVADTVPRSQYDALNTQYTALQSSYDTLQGEYEEMEADLASLQEDYDELAASFDALQNQGYSTSGLDDGEEQSPESMSGIVSAIFGTYSPKTQTVTQTLDNGSVVTSQEIIPGVAGMDWHWIAGVVLFSIVLWSFFRFLGVIFKHG